MQFNVDKTLLLEIPTNYIYLLQLTYILSCLRFVVDFDN